MKKKLYLIIGNGKCGKSSLVRALTGVYRSATVQIGLDDENNTNFWTRVLPQSAQEAGLSPQNLIKRIEKYNGHTHVLATLRLNEYNKQPSAIDYLNELDKSYDIQTIVYMGNQTDIGYIKFKDIPFNILNNSYDRPINVNASKVRKWWGWL